MPDSPEAHFGLGLISAVRGDMEGAREKLRILEKLGSPLADRLRQQING
jgi:hypothetical protein